MKVLFVSGKRSEFSISDPIDRYAFRLSELLGKRVGISHAWMDSTSLVSGIKYKKRVRMLSRHNDIVHITTQGFGYVCGNLMAPSVVTCHDLIPFVFPQRFSLRRFMQKRNIRNSVKAEKIISVSENTKNDIIKILGYPESRVRTVLQGVDPIFRPMKTRKFGFDKNYIHVLYTGSDLPHKNVPLLLRAIKRISEKEDVKLVKTFCSTETARYIKKLGIEDKVIVTGVMDYGSLPHLYNSCDVFVCPSLYEGWGLTPLEAMACGLPVVCSDAASLPEVVGDSALIFNPNSQEDLEKSLKDVLNDNGLSRKLSRKGMKRSKRFDWKKTAKETLGVYEELIK